MVQPKFDKASKQVTPRVNKQNGNQVFVYTKWISICTKFHLVFMAMLFCRLLDLAGNGPLSVATKLDIKDLDWKPSVMFAIAVLQFDALVYVFFSSGDLSARVSTIKFDRTTMVFKYMQFCIPQVILGGLLLLQPQGFDFALQFKITLIWNPFSILLVLIQSYIRLLQKKRSLAKGNSPQKKGSDEIPTVTVTSVP